MKKPLLLLFLFFSANKIIKAQDFIYKYNAVGQLELFRSSYGIPEGQKLATIKKNPLGYIEVVSTNENEYFNQTENPYSRKPEIIPVQPYLAPIAGILNNINRFLEVNKKVVSVQNNQFGLNDGAKEYLAIMTKMSQQYKEFTGFYNSVKNKPLQVKNGWHSVVIMNSSLAETFNKTNQAAGIAVIEKFVQIGYGYVENNKLVNVIECNFTQAIDFIKPAIISSGLIENCKTIYKWREGESSFNEVYFIDYLLDNNEQATLPSLGTFKFNFSDDINGIVGLIFYKKDPSIYGEGEDNYIGWRFIPKFKDGTRSTELSSFTSYPGTYYYVALDPSKNKWQGNFTLSDNSFSAINIVLK